MNKILLIFFLLIALMQNIFAEDSIYYLKKQIDVEADRLELVKQFSTYSSIKFKSLESSNSFQVNDILRFVPGTHINDYGGLGGLKTVSLRGQTSSQNTVLLDGMKINQTSTGSFDFSTLPASIVDEISVYKGGMSAFFGSGAIGGALNIKTNLPDSVKLAGTFSTGLFNTYHSLIRGSFSLSNFKQGVLIEYNTSEGDYPFKINNFGKIIEYKRKNSDYSNIVLFLNNQYDKKNTKIKSNFILNIDERGSPGAVIYGRPENLSASLENKSLLFTLNFEQLFNTGAKFFTGISANNGISEYSDNLNIVYGLPNTISYFNNDFALKSKYSHLFGKLFNELEFEYTYSQISGNMLEKSILSEIIKRNEFAITWCGSLFQTTKAFEFAFNSALRLNKTEHYSPIFLPFIAFTINSKVLQTTLKANYSYNFRVPSFNEMYYLNYGNTELKPEFSHSVNVELTSQIFENLQITAVAFLIDTKDKIISVPKSAVSWTAANIARTLNKGIELNTIASFYEKKIDFVFSYTRQVPLDKSINSLSYDKIIVYIPQEIFSSTILFNFNFLNLGTRFYYSSHTFSLQDNSYASLIPNYYLLDAFTSKHWKIGKSNLFLSLTIANIFNKQYSIIANYPMPGRNLQFKIAYSL